MANRLRSEPEPLECGSKMMHLFDKERGLLDLLYCTKFAQEQHGEVYHGRLKQPFLADG